MERFVLKVDLTSFYKNIYQKVLILADSKWETVGKVETIIKNKFCLNSEIGLLSSEGYYIPSEESIEILKHVVSVTAFKKQSQNRTITSKSETHVMKTHESILNREGAPKKKRSIRELNENGFTTSTPTVNFAKKHKGMDFDGNIVCESIVTLKDSDIIKSIMQESPKSKTNLSSKATEENTSNRDANSNNGISSLKNKDLSTKKSRSHIFFNEADEEFKSNSNSEQKVAKTQIALVCDLENSKRKMGRIFEVGTKTQNHLEINIENNANHVKSPSENGVLIIENVTLVEANDKFTASENNTSHIEQTREATKSIPNVRNNENKASKSHEESVETSVEHSESLVSCGEIGVIVLDDSEMVNRDQDSVNVSSQGVSTESKEYCIEKMLKSSELKDLPCVGDFIAFKLNLSNGKPSDYFLGQCEYANKRTKAIKVQLTDGLSQISLIPSKFASNIDDSVDFMRLNIKLQDLLEAKICQN